MPAAIVMTDTGGPEVLRLQNVDRPEPGPGQIVIEVAAAGVNYVETYQRQGVYPVPLPFTPGAEAAGTVVAVREGAPFSVGDRVATAEARATYAQYAVIDGDKAVRVPAGVDDRTAAALPLQGFTAHFLATSAFPAGPEHTVLLHAGAGGVGLLLTQLLKRAGARVITTVSTDEKAELSRRAGADEVLRYAGFRDRVREITDGEGVAAVYDGVGRDTFDDSLGSLALRGTLVLFGAASGPVPPVDPQRLNHAGSVFLTRPTMAHYLRNAEERAWRAEDLFNAVASGALSVQVDGEYPLAEAARAHEDLQARRTTGKLLLLP